MAKLKLYPDSKISHEYQLQRLKFRINLYSMLHIKYLRDEML